jgi:hypothetical protein
VDGRSISQEFLSTDAPDSPSSFESDSSLGETFLERFYEDNENFKAFANQNICEIGIGAASDDVGTIISEEDIDSASSGTLGEDEEEDELSEVEPVAQPMHTLSEDLLEMASDELLGASLQLNQALRVREHCASCDGIDSSVYSTIESEILSMHALLARERQTQAQAFKVGDRTLKLPGLTDRTIEEEVCRIERTLSENLIDNNVKEFESLHHLINEEIAEMESFLLAQCGQKEEEDAKKLLRMLSEALDGDAQELKALMKQ